MRRYLSNFVQEGEEVKQFWKLITAEKKYLEQIKIFRDNAKFESVSVILHSMPCNFYLLTLNWIHFFFQDVLRIRSRRFNDEIDAAAERDKKRKELDKDNEYTSTPTCTRTEMNNESEEKNDEEYVNADEEEITFWAGSDQKRRKSESLLTPHKPILTRQMFDVLSTKVITGLKSLKSVVAMRYSEIADEIEIMSKNRKSYLAWE
jgi:hypothetical protein